MVEISKKITEKFFDKILSGEKKFEIRLADQEYNVGDILILNEIDDDEEYTGRSLKKKIGCLSNTKTDNNHWPQDQIDKYGLIVIQLDEYNGKH